jgi:hypothetical protein
LNFTFENIYMFFCFSKREALADYVLII